MFAEIAVPHTLARSAPTLNRRGETHCAEALQAEPLCTGRKVLGNMQLTGIRPAQDAEYDVVRNIVARVLGEHY